MDVCPWVSLVCMRGNIFCKTLGGGNQGPLPRPKVAKLLVKGRRGTGKRFPDSDLSPVAVWDPKEEMMVGEAGLLVFA